MESFDVLAREFDVKGGLFLEASAGTGKTFAIEHLVLRLLLEGDAPLSIDQILVVTFTRAATRELKVRIRSNIEKAKGALDGGGSEWDYLQAQIDLGDERRYACLARLEEALVRFDEAAIFTIHGFCHKVLSEGAFDAHVGLQVSEPESRKHLPLMYEALIDALRIELTPPAFSSHQILHLLKRAKGDPNQLAADVLSLIEKDKEIPKQKEFSELLETFNEKIASFQVTSPRILADFDALVPCYKLMTSSEFHHQMRTLAAILDQGSADEEAFDTLLKGTTFFLEKMVPENQKVRAHLPEPEDLNYPGIVEALQESILPLIQQGKDPKLLLLRLAHASKKRWNTFFFTHDHLPPDDLLKKTNEALKNPQFLKAIQERFGAVIIDEFQDTDPVQFNIVHTLYREKGPALYLVGDPKQSIYGFRRADVYTYLQASSLLPPSRCFVLGTNFRSDPPLIEALNALFSHSKQWMPLPTKGEAMTFHGALAPKDKESKPIGDDKGSVHFLFTEAERGREKSWPTKQVEQDVFFPYLCKEVAALSSEKEIPLSEIAILVKDRFQAERVKAALKKGGIPSRLRRKETAQESRARLPLIEVLKGVLQPDDTSFLKRALASPLFGWAPESLQDRQRVFAAKPLFYTLREEWSRRGIEALFHKLMQSSIDGNRVEEHLLERKDLDFYSSLKQCVHLLCTKEREGQLSPHELLEFFETLDENPTEEALLPPAQAAEGVQIMTLHMSKGLEFDIVICLGLCSRHMQLDEFAADGDLLVPSTEIEAPHHETDAEKLRQLYVALTRAKRRVYIPTLIDAKACPIPAGTASPLELFFAQLLSPDGESSIKALYEKHLPFKKETILALLEQFKTVCSLSYERVELHAYHQRPPLCSLSTPSLLPTPITFSLSTAPLLSFSSLTKKQERVADPLDFTESLTPHGLPLGAETGVVLHHIFEQLFLRHLHAPFDGEAIEALIKEDIRGNPLEKWEGVIFDMVKETLHLPLNGISLTDLKRDEVLQEIEFVYPSSEGFIKGFIDLAFEVGEKYYILDWKSNYLGPDDDAYSLEAMERCMQEHDYFLQASIYTEGLKRYLAHFDKRPFEECFGGAIYLFLRGRRAYFSRR